MKKQYETQDKKPTILEDPQSMYMSNSYYHKAYAEISKNYIKSILKKARLSVQELIGIIPISIDTYKRKTVFNSGVTEKILEIEEVYNRGLETFGESFHDWMNTTNIALGNVAPKTLLHNSFGVRMLLDEIGRMEHGILT